MILQERDEDLLLVVQTDKERQMASANEILEMMRDEAVELIVLGIDKDGVFFAEGNTKMDKSYTLVKQLKKILKEDLKNGTNTPTD